MAYVEKGIFMGRVRAIWSRVGKRVCMGASLSVSGTLLQLGGCAERTICVEEAETKSDGVFHLPNQVRPFTGRNLCEFENGQKRLEGRYEDGKREGVWTWWHENGRKMMEGSYQDNKRVGIWFVAYENGLKQSEGPFRDDKRDGKWIYWDTDGQVKFERIWDDGEPIF